MKTNTLVFLILFQFSISSAQNLTNGFMAYYPFNSNVNDESGNGLNGTLNGATYVVDRFGNPNSALHFNPNTYIKLPTLMFLSNATKFSFSFWIRYPNGIGGWNTIFDAGGKYYIGAGKGENKDRDSLTISQTVGFYYMAGNTINEGTKWSHIVVVFDETAKTNFYSIYQNGVLLNTQLISGEKPTKLPSFLENEIFSLGASTYNSGYLELDDVGFWSRNLTEAEIQELFKKVTTGNDEIEDVKIKILPNPANNYLIVDFINGSKTAILELYDVTGKMVLQKEVYKNEQIQVSPLERGVYVYKLNHQEKIRTGKIVLQ